MNYGKGQRLYNGEYVEGYIYKDGYKQDYDRIQIERGETYAVYRSTVKNFICYGVSLDDKSTIIKIYEGDEIYGCVGLRDARSKKFNVEWRTENKFIASLDSVESMNETLRQYDFLMK